MQQRSRHLYDQSSLLSAPEFVYGFVVLVLFILLHPRDAFEMPSSIDLEPFRVEIERRLLSSDQSMSQIVKWLTDDHSVEITQRTLEQRYKT